MDADYAALQLRRGASAAEIRSNFLALSRRHHPDRGGDAALFRRVSQAYQRLSRPGDGAGGGGPSGPRATRENAPAAWARPEAPERGAQGVLALEHDPQLEAAFRFAGETRKHLHVIDRYPAHAGWTFSSSGAECGPSCLTHVAPATPDGVACASHKRVHRCAAGVCCSEERACPMTVLCLAQQWRQRQPGVLPAEALAAHQCTPAKCRWTELPQLRHPPRGPPQRRVYVCAASGRPHICTAAQCRAGREKQVLDERGGLARQWRCQISDMPLGPLTPWQDGITLALGTAEVGRLEWGGGSAASNAGSRGAAQISSGRGGGGRGAAQMMAGRGGGRGSAPPSVAGRGGAGRGPAGAGRSGPPAPQSLGRGAPQGGGRGAPQPLFKRPRLGER